MSGNIASMEDPILKVEHMSMKFGGLVAIGDLSFEAQRGEITALIGPNGAGKTTVFNCITGFYKPSEGMITLRRKAGEEFLLERMADFEITAKAKVARTFQNIRLFSGLTVLENLLVAQHNTLMKASGFSILGMFGAASYKKATKSAIEKSVFWLEKIGLVERADDPAGDLPYGAQRRLEIARAMCTDPEMLCLDEPAAGLNPRESLALNELLLDIKKTSGTSILLIEHDMSVVMEISDHVVVLEYGRKISDGTPNFVQSDPKVIAAYLGVDDADVNEALSEAGSELVIEGLDGEPDVAHGPSASSSMFAGPISETINHSGGEMVTISPLASASARVKPQTTKATKTATPAMKTAASKAKAKRVADVTAPVFVAALPKKTASAKASSRSTAMPKATKSSATKSSATKSSATKSATSNIKTKSAVTVSAAASAKASARSKPALKPATGGKTVISKTPTKTKSAKTVSVAPVAIAAEKLTKATRAKKAASVAPSTKKSAGVKIQEAAKPVTEKPKALKAKAKSVASVPPKVVAPTKAVSAKAPAGSKPAPKAAGGGKTVLSKAPAKTKTVQTQAAKTSAAAPLAPAAEKLKKVTAAKKSVVAKPAKAAQVSAKAEQAPKPVAKRPEVSKPKATNVVRSAGSVADDLTVIKGIGPVNNRKLNGHGIVSFAQIAAWKKADIAAVEAYLEFDGRIAREDWIGQAKALAKSAVRAKGRKA